VLDAAEAAAIAAAIGGSTPVTATRSVTGESLGAAGALQAVFALQTLRSRRVPGIVGLEAADPAVRINIHPSARPLAAERALVTAASHEGNTVALVLSLN
jgi:3-oxoacyl-[acyl-carrier-protein] synthase II